MKDLEPRYRFPWALAVALSVAAGTAVWAQETPSPAPAAGSQAAEAYLVYKFRPGAVYRYHYSAGGTINIDLSSLALSLGAGAPGPVSLDITSEYDIIEKVESVSASGGATLLLSLDNLIAVVRGAEQNVVVRLRGGRLTVTNNGQPTTPARLKNRDAFAGQT